jgi:hypothetical protein
MAIPVRHTTGLLLVRPVLTVLFPVAEFVSINALLFCRTQELCVGTGDHRFWGENCVKFVNN